MVENNDVLLTIKDLVVEYTSDKQIIHAVNGVSLEIKKGRTLGLAGETGAGKTTIAKSIMRLLPDPPAKIKGGEIYFEGKNVLEMGDDELKRLRGGKISMIFQDPMTALNPVMRVGDQISEVIGLHSKVDSKEAEKRARDMLEMVGIPGDRFREYPHQFSGGMKQRVVIAIALACNPTLLLADEPTTALDVTIQAQIMELINGLKVKQNTSMCLITHDLGVIAESCDDVAIIYAGQIVEYGSLEEVFVEARHPYTLGLFGALPNMISRNERLRPVPGQPADPSDLPKGCAFHPRCIYATEKCRHTCPENVSLGGTHTCRCHNISAVKGRGR
ncbi:MAG: ABC transporter ATP-binding protein [Lachnospiraceae bacterium]|nr:ABC transporter ATP-binding protein [Lachnospiraceae bacterium]